MARIRFQLGGKAGTVHRIACAGDVAICGGVDDGVISGRRRCPVGARLPVRLMDRLRHSASKAHLGNKTYLGIGERQPGAHCDAHIPSNGEPEAGTGNIWIKARPDFKRLV